MGLDMYLTGEKFVMDSRLNLKEDGFRLRSKTIELGYWRKHPNLHGYIVQTFAGGEDQCQNIDLGVPDRIRSIIAAIEARTLPDTTGFFFGVSDTSPERVAEDIAIFRKALAWLETEEAGVFRSVIYRASW
ncbi:MAG: phosphoglycerate kinase [Terriglobia bacterium]